MADFNPVQTSPYSFSYKLKSRLWCFVNRTFYRWSPFFMRKYRVALVRLVGGGMLIGVVRLTQRQQL